MQKLGLVTLKKQCHLHSLCGLCWSVALPVSCQVTTDVTLDVTSGVTTDHGNPQKKCLMLPLGEPP